MDKQILDAFAAEMLELLQTGSEFIGEQVPVVCQEILRYHLATGLLGLGVGVALWFAGRWVFKKLVPLCDSDDVIVPHICTGLIWFMAGIVGVVNALNILKILIAPRIFLIDYFAELVR